MNPKTSPPEASGDPRDVRWLHDFLRPWITSPWIASPGITSPGITPEPGTERDGDASVQLVRDVGEHDALARAFATTPTSPTPCFVLDREIVTLPGYTRGPERVVADGFLRAFYRVEEARRGAKVRIVARPGDLRARFAAVRVVREQVRVGPSQTGWISLHAAAAEVGGGGVVLVGGKGAGKTTVLAHLLAAAGATFVANDWVRIGVAGGGVGGEVEVHGMPTVVRVRAGSERWVPALGATEGEVPSFLHRPGEDDPSTARPEAGVAEDGVRHEAPGTFARRLRAACRASAPLRQWLFLERRDRGPFDWIRVSPEEATRRLAASLYGGEAGACAATLFGRPAPVDLEAGLRRLAALAPAWVVPLGPTAYTDGVLERRVAS